VRPGQTASTVGPNRDSPLEMWPVKEPIFLTSPFTDRTRRFPFLPPLDPRVGAFIVSVPCFQLSIRKSPGCPRAVPRTDAELLFLLLFSLPPSKLASCRVFFKDIESDVFIPFSAHSIFGDSLPSPGPFGAFFLSSFPYPRYGMAGDTPAVVERDAGVNFVSGSFLSKRPP